MNEKEELNNKEKKAGSPIFILLIFIVLLGFVFYVPDIYEKYHSNIADFLGIGSKNNDTPKGSEDNRSAVSDYFQIGSGSTLTYNEITISNVSLERNILSFDISSEKSIDLDELHYYLEFFEKKSTFVGRRSLSGKVVKNKSFKIDVSSLGITDVTYFVVSHIDDDSIPKITLETDESSLGNIVCTKENDEYTYTFSKNLLNKVVRKYTYTNSDINFYSSELFKYQKMANDYNELNGVTASIAENGATFIYTVELDYETIKSYPKVDDEFKYEKDSIPGIIKFKMDAEGYKCV